MSNDVRGVLVRNRSLVEARPHVASNKHDCSNRKSGITSFEGWSGNDLSKTRGSVPPTPIVGPRMTAIPPIIATSS
jgi:hypothetical protein